MFSQVLASWSKRKISRFRDGRPRCRNPGLGAAAHLQGVALTQPQLLFIVVHSPTGVLHVSQGGGQGHMDDGQLGPRPVQQLRKVQLRMQQGGYCTPSGPRALQSLPSPPHPSSRGAPASGRPSPPWGSRLPWRTGPPAAHRCPWRSEGHCSQTPPTAAAAGSPPALTGRASCEGAADTGPSPALPSVRPVPSDGPPPRPACLPVGKKGVVRESALGVVARATRTNR